MALAIERKPLDEEKLMGFIGKALTDFGATISAPLVVLGDKLGLYKAMAGAGPLSPAELAERTGTVERYIREWLQNQAVSGYVEFDPETGKYTLPDEHAVALTDENSPYYMVGGYSAMLAIARAEPKISEAFKTGAGLPWGEQDHTLFPATERFFKPGYVGNLVSNWIPSLEGVKEKLERGAKVADVGCGHGVSTILLAKAFPNSHFYGFDIHGPSIERAREAAREAGVEANTTFETATATTYPAKGYDLIMFFDCLHDMGEPETACRYACNALADDGTVMIVEPMAGESVEQNFNPVGRVFSGASTLCCTPNGVSQGHHVLGALAPETAINEVVELGGFSRFRRATETPFNRVFEARK